MEDGQIGLIDFGQVKQISGRNRETLCKVMIALDERRQRDPVTESDILRKDDDLVGQLALELGVQLKETSPAVAAAAVGVWLFDGSVEGLPGGYDLGELSPNSPVKELKSFPQDLVLVGRATILVKGLSNRLGVTWSLAREWAPIARQVLDPNFGAKRIVIGNDGQLGTRIRFIQVWRMFRQWLTGRITRAARILPPTIQRRLAALILRVEEWKKRRILTKRKRSVKKDTCGVS